MAKNREKSKIRMLPYINAALKPIQIQQGSFVGMRKEFEGGSKVPCR